MFLPANPRRAKPSAGHSSVLPALIAALATILLSSPFALAQADETAATRLMIEAQRLEQSRGGEAALLEYEALVKRFPNSVLAPKALAASAQIEFDMGNLEQAQETAKNLFDSYSSSGEGATGLVLQARILVAQGGSLSDLDDALTLLKRVPNLFGNLQYPLLESRTEARVLAGELLIQLGDLGAAASSFVEAVEDEPRGRFTLPALIGLGRVLALRGDQIAAMETFQLAIDEGLDDDDADSLLQVADARRRLTLLYRFSVRPTMQQKPWTTSTPIVGTAEWKKPRGLAVSGTGNLLVTDSSVGVIRIDAEATPGGAGNSSSLAARNAGRPFIDPRDRYYVPTESSIRQLDPAASETFKTDGDKPKQLEKLQAGARGILGEWYLIDKSLDGVQVFSKTGEMEATLSADLDVKDVALDERGRLFVLSQKPSRVTIHDLDRGAIKVVPGSWSKPTAVDVDWLGHIYVLDGSNNTVQVVDQSGTQVAKIPAGLPGAGALRSAEDIAVDDAGRVYISDSRLQTVYRLN